MLSLAYSGAVIRRGAGRCRAPCAGHTRRSTSPLGRCRWRRRRCAPALSLRSIARRTRPPQVPMAADVGVRRRDSRHAALARHADRSFCAPKRSAAQRSACRAATVRGALADRDRRLWRHSTGLWWLDRLAQRHLLVDVGFERGEFESPASCRRPRCCRARPSGGASDQAAPPARRGVGVSEHRQACRRPDAAHRRAATTRRSAGPGSAAGPSAARPAIVANLPGNARSLLEGGLLPSSLHRLSARRE